MRSHPYQSPPGWKGPVETGFVHIVANDAPQTLVRDLDDPCCSNDWHFTDEHHGYLFKEQGDLTAFPGLGDIHPSDAVFVALDPGDIGCEIAMELEEVEMLPGEFLEAWSCRVHRTQGTETWSLGWH